MDLSLIAENFLNPPVLFFLLGLAAALLRSDLSIPDPVPRLLALYLLLSIGFRGGVELSNSGLSAGVLSYLVAAVAMATVVPFYVFFLLRRRIGVFDAAAVSAAYGSVSAITFITAVALLQKLKIPVGGHSVAALALMESPAIVVGVFLARRFGGAVGGAPLHTGEILRDAFLNGSVFLLLGSFLIGLATGHGGWQALEAFTSENFSGLLSFFLLDMGLLAGKRIADLRRAGGVVVLAAVAIPLINAAAAIAVAAALRMAVGEALLFTVLCASASYIAVPAALRLAIPQASATIYVSMSLAVTFPFNIVLGIPLYLFVIRALWG